MHNQITQTDAAGDRAVMLGTYILEHRATVRAAAKQYGISKSTVHKDVSERLPYIQPELAEQVHEILLQNKQERHIRGGMATKKKYARLRECAEHLEQ
ncbi:MAG: sporulation transcriptional regulator SpoIIID [Oscillospiraceae bacterium]|nr:sporulation transcriptional regulator SpoIIID [Oscillospiraceae bacterium]